MRKFKDKTDVSSMPPGFDQMSGTIGVIASYDEKKNTATVLITQNNSDEIREVLNNVPCPAILGAQQVFPEPGRMCYVVFKNGSISYPLIVNFYNAQYEKYDYPRMRSTPIGLPNYLMD